MEQQILAAGLAVGVSVAELRDSADPEEAKVWLRRWLPLVCRRLRHGGNLKYVFGLSRSAKKAIRRSFPHGTDGSSPRSDYPKFSTLVDMSKGYVGP